MSGIVSLLKGGIGAFPEGYRPPTARVLRNLVKNVGPLAIRKRLNFTTYYGCRGLSSYNENSVEGVAIGQVAPGRNTLPDKTVVFHFRNGLEESVALEEAQ